MCYDHVRYVSTGRPNPENTTPLYKMEQVPSDVLETTLGMAGNVQKCLQNLGADVRTLFPPTSQYSSKARFYEVDKNYLLPGKAKPIFRLDTDIVAERLPLVTQANLLGVDAVVVSDYCKGAIDDTFLKVLQVFCHAKNIPMFVDSKKKNLDYLTYAYVKVNKKEASEMLQQPPADRLIVTLGEQGALHQEVTHPSPKVNCVDVCGAGDSFLAALAYGFLQFKGNISEAIRLANIAAAKSVTEYGTYGPKLNELDVNAKLW